MRRPAWIPILLLPAAALVWLLIQGSGDPDLGGDPTPENAEETDVGHAEGPARRAPVELGDRAEDRPPGSAAVGVDTDAPEQSDGGREGPRGDFLRLRVHDRVTQQPLRRFSYIWLQDGERSTGVGEDGRVELEVIPDRPGQVVVEADGHVPESRSEVTVHAGTGATELVLYLAPLPDSIGVELTVRDPEEQPVPHVRVDAWRLDPDEQAEDAIRRAALWSRRASDDAGVYRLPELQPGRYHLRVRALSEAGDQLPLLPHTATVAFHGSEHLPLFVALQPGALLALDVVDVTGAAMGPGTGLRVFFPDGDARDVTWIVEKDGERLAARGGLPAAGTAHASEPLPPGSYRLEFFTGGELRHTAWLELAAGERRTERILLPSGR